MKIIRRLALAAQMARREPLFAITPRVCNNINAAQPILVTLAEVDWANEPCAHWGLMRRETIGLEDKRLGAMSCALA